MRPFGQAQDLELEFADEDRPDTCDRRCSRAAMRRADRGILVGADRRSAHRGAVARAGADRGQNVPNCRSGWSAASRNAASRSRSRCRSTRSRRSARRRGRGRPVPISLADARTVALRRPTGLDLRAWHRTPSCNAARRGRRDARHAGRRGKRGARRRACRSPMRWRRTTRWWHSQFPALARLRRRTRSSCRPRGCGPGAARRAAARAAARGPHAGVALRLDRERSPRRRSRASRPIPRADRGWAMSDYFGALMNSVGARRSIRRARRSAPAFRAAANVACSIVELGATREAQRGQTRPAVGRAAHESRAAECGGPSSDAAPAAADLRRAAPRANDRPPPATAVAAPMAAEPHHASFAPHWSGRRRSAHRGAAGSAEQTSSRWRRLPTATTRDAATGYRIVRARAHGDDRESRDRGNRHGAADQRLGPPTETATAGASSLANAAPAPRIGRPAASGRVAPRRSPTRSWRFRLAPFMSASMRPCRSSGRAAPPRAGCRPSDPPKASALSRRALRRF